MSRPIWSGTINFGLVSIPIELVTAIHEKSIHFHILSPDGHCRLRQKLYCPETGKEYDFKQTARGVEIAPEEFVIIDQKEISKLKPEKGRAMDIEQFIDLAAVDPVYYDHVYYVRPAGEALKAFKLFVEAMKGGKKCALARFVMRDRQHLAVLRPANDGLVLHTLHYADEVDSVEDLLPAAMKKVKTAAGEEAMAEQLLKSMTRPLDLSAYKDEYRERLEKMIEGKVKGREVVEVSEEQPHSATRTINLMDALKKSLESARESNAHARTRRKSA